MELFADNAQTTLASTASVGANHLTVASATGFPASSGTFRILVDSELLTVSSVSGTTFNLAANTTVQHNAGAPVTAVLTAEALAALKSDVLATAGTWSGQIYGFPLNYVSSTSLNVGFPNANAPTSLCRDAADAAFVTLAGGTQITVTTSTAGAAGGDDSFQGGGTVQVAAGAAVVGTSTHFTTDFGTRTLTGTIGSSSTTVTGTGTKFLSEVAIGDLIGDGSKFQNVTAIASDTSLTTGGALGVSGGTTAKLIEQATVTVQNDNSSPHAVIAIADDTHLTLAEATSNSASGLNYWIGRTKYPHTPPAGSQYANIFMVSGGSGTSAVVSTQRTKPYAAGFGGSSGISGYTTSYRRIGSLKYDNSGNIIAFTQTGLGAERKVRYDIAPGSGTQVLNGGTASGSWTAVVCSGAVPPTAAMLHLDCVLVGTYFGYLRRRNFGDSTISRNIRMVAAGSLTETPFLEMQWDGQAIDYSFDSGASGQSLSLYVIGYTEYL